RNLKRTIEELDGGLVLITDLADAYVISKHEWIFYSRFRFSSLMKETSQGWLFIYQHFSTPDTKAQEGETLGTEQITKENQQLRDAIKRRTVELENKSRELEIEAALERVRASAMSMRSSENFFEVIHVLREQMAALDEKELESIIIHIYEKGSEDFEVWFSYRHARDPKGKIIHGKVNLNWTSTERARLDKEKYYAEDENEYTIV